MAQKKWTIRKHDHERVRSFARELDVQPVIAALLVARGYDTYAKAETFLRPSLSALHDPYLLKGMRQAVERIRRAVREHEKILIWGDYDVDGTTGTVLLRRALRHLGAEAEYHVPNRFTEGYGVNIPALEAAVGDGVSLVITVDCGIRSFEPLEWAAVNSLDVIVTDHHLSDEVRGNPPAVAVVNPNQPGCEYPDKSLAGVGVAFKLADALLREEGLEHEIPNFLKIAAIGTVADVMDLTGENRAIVALGLQDLVLTDNCGLRALMEAANCTAEMTSLHIGFRIGPRINAAGRMDVAKHVIELLEAEDFVKARQLAALLDSRNRERQQTQQRITELAFAEAAEHGASNFVVVAGEGWHRGVIGLAASRIAEKLYRPTIVLSVEDGIAQGSARSIPGFHLLNALEAVEDLFEQFGGHRAAAGMKLQAERIPELRRRLSEYAGSTLSAEDLVPELEIDAVLLPETIDFRLLEALSALEPFGQGNPRPIFVTKGLTLRQDPFVMKEKHLKLHLESDSGRQLEAVWWDGVDRSKGRTLRRGSRIELAYVLEINSWQGNRKIQLVVEDFREA
ncbi:MAG: single-stranded-DNA-specific exonuclease RecJ [Acidobacteria bacterium OLB17]|nr:MAG: single-stranded-DNA-specific exonuclease RecJ [Acidobacteria bacterium OLB17]MCZ2392077.1 single-stranded-DNA-specific exonuclease RecJ [Acidobacteriota bacterium]